MGVVGCARGLRVGGGVAACAWVLEMLVSEGSASGLPTWRYVSAGAVFWGVRSSLIAYDTELLGAEFLMLAVAHFLGWSIKGLANSVFLADCLVSAPIQLFAPFKSCAALWGL